MDSLTIQYNTLKLALEGTPDEYYYYREFDSSDIPGSGKNMDSLLLNKLKRMRLLLGYNLKINSGYRTHGRNKAAGGVSDSAHRSKDAVDVRVLSSDMRYDVMKAAIQAGFNRVGIHKRFIHLDVDSTKQQEVLWLY